MKVLIVRDLGVADYTRVWSAMRQFTDTRDEHTPDEIWLTEHPPVYTQGQAGKAEHVLAETSIPVVASDRGGQVTYHGPGQLIAYVLLDLKRAGGGVRQLVTALEQAVIIYLQRWNIHAEAKLDAPGVYVDSAKIASLGLRVRRGRSFHGLSLNIDMDLSPFLAINPCGYPGMKMLQLSELVEGRLDMAAIRQTFSEDLLAALKNIVSWDVVEPKTGFTAE